jgi:hypothetical protein
MDENQVIHSLCAHLASTGYEITQQLHTTEHGIDIIATERTTGRKLLVEAKGGTSSRVGSNRFGLPYTQTQVYDRVSKGIFTVMQLRSQHPDTLAVSVALAVPDSPWFRQYIRSVIVQLAALSIQVLSVRPDGSVLELTADASARGIA